MSKVTFDIEFTVNSLVELIGRASISRVEAEKVEGLVDNLDTVIRLDQLGGNMAMQVEQPKSNKKGRKGKEKVKEKEKSIKISEDNDFDDQGDDLDGELDDDMINIQPPNMEQDQYYDDYYDDQENDNNDDSEDDDILMNIQQRKVTKRQRGQLELNIQLPLKKSRKKGKNQQQDQLKKLEKDEKRRQQMKKHIERQRMQTLNQILNQTGRKQRMRNQKQTKDKQSKQNKTFKTLGDVPKTVLVQNKDQEYVVVHNTNLFSDQMLAQPIVVSKPNCYICNKKGKYKVNEGRTVCSLPCYKQHEFSVPKKMQVQS